MSQVYYEASKKKRNSASSRETYHEALKKLSYVIAGVIKKVSIGLSKAIGENMNEKHMQLEKELERRTTTLTIIERRKIPRMIMRDNAMVSYFFSVPDNSRDE